MDFFSFFLSSSITFCKRRNLSKVLEEEPVLEPFTFSKEGGKKAKEKNPEPLASSSLLLLLLLSLMLTLMLTLRVDEGTTIVISWVLFERKLGDEDVEVAGVLVVVFVEGSSIELANLSASMAFCVADIINAIDSLVRLSPFIC